ncbi:MAG: IS5 family transposase [bacterium]|nr:IS5 family transposase [bacterium]
MSMQIERDPQMTIMKYDLNALVRQDHQLRKINTTVDFCKIARKYVELKTTVGRKGYGLDVGIKCLFLQFYYDLSDRELENRLRDDMALRWFCGINLEEDTPDHTFFCRIRTILGARRIGQVFKNIMQKAEEKGIVRKVFTFVDSTAVKTKETTWQERDKAIRDGEESLNNDNVEDYSADKDARFGCKGEDKFWYGYKKHVNADMGSGLIRKVAVTPANTSDQAGFRHICPDGGMVFADKAYCLKEAQEIMRSRNCHSGAVLKNNMLKKNKDKDRWISKIRAQFEGIFSKEEKRARYRGLMKAQLQAFMETIVFNVKRLIVINAPPLFDGA